MERVEQHGEGVGDVDGCALPTDGRPSTEIPAPEPRRFGRLALSVLVMGLGAAAWHGSGRYFAHEAQQLAADRWDELRVCLLGDALMPGDKPSERVRLTRLASEQAPSGEDAWPRRCVDYADRLDEALGARAVQESVGTVPSAGYVVRRLDDAGARADLDLLHEIFEAADLPLAKRSSVVPSPPPAAKVQLGKAALTPVGHVIRLSDIDAAFDARTGRSLRFVLPLRRAHLCRLQDGSATERWGSLGCKSSPLVTKLGARLSLASADEGAPELIRVQDAGDGNGFFDASTGLRVWPSRYFDAQAHVTAAGVTTIVLAELDDDTSRGNVDHFKLLRTAPGRAPSPHRLPLPPDARILLLPHALVWWATDAAPAPGRTPRPKLSAPDDDSRLEDTVREAKATPSVLMAQALTADPKQPLAPPERLGTLAPASRMLGWCADGATTAVLFSTGLEERRYALLFHDNGAWKPLTDVGVIEGRVSLSCHSGAAMLTRVADRRVARWRCDPEGCQLGLSGPIAALEQKTVAVAPVGDKVAVAWAAPGGALRLRIGAPVSLASMNDTVVLDDADHGGLETTELRFLGAAGSAVLLVQDAGTRVYALRMDERGLVTPVAVTR